MHALHRTTSAGDLKTYTNAVFEKAKEGPVVVLSRATPKAVMISPEEWDRLAHRLERLELLVAHYRNALEMERHPSRTFKLEDIERELLEVA